MISRIISICLLLMVVLSLPIGALSEETRYLILHLDGVPASLLMSELSAGQLPNLSKAFAGGGEIAALSLFPGGTEMMYPRLKKGVGSSSGWPVAWTHYDRIRGKVVSKPAVFLKMASAVPREARYQLIEGFTRADTLAGLAMLNLPRLLQRHKVIEFFWFPTDGAGHLAGEKGMKQSMRNFDSWFGRILTELNDMERLNLILYSDHGMAFSREEVDLTKVIQEVVGEELLFYSYPNIYLKDPTAKEETARRLVGRSEIDLTLVKSGSEKVLGYSEEGEFLIQLTNDFLRYDWKGPGSDPFNFEGVDYVGQTWSDDEWLSRTHTLSMPAAPVNLGRYVVNPNVGDIVVVINPPQRDITPICREGGHLGITLEDLGVAVLFKGPDLTALSNEETLWLHQLYTFTPGLFEDTRPDREENMLLYGPKYWEVSLSPVYNWRIALRPDQVSLRYAAITTYLGRIWLETDITPNGLERWSFRLEAQLGSLHLYRRIVFAEANPLPSDFGLGYDLTKSISLEWRPGQGGAISVRW